MATCTACASSCQHEVKPHCRNGGSALVGATGGCFAQLCGVGSGVCGGPCGYLSGEGAPEQSAARRVLAFGGLSSKVVPGQATALHLRGRRFAPTALRCSVLQPAAELASLRQWRRVSSRSALARAAASPVLLGAPQARRGLSGHAFAGNAVVRGEREEPSRQAVPAGGDLWSDEDRRTGVGERSAFRELTRRHCLSAANAVSEASSATRPLAENRSAVVAQRRPRNHEPPAGTAWRDANAPCDGDATRATSSGRGQETRRHCTGRVASSCRDHSSWRFLNG